MKYNKENIKLEALKYNTKTDFFTKSSGHYGAAKRLKILKEVCSHMQKRKAPNKKWTFEIIKAEALKYNNREDFKKNSYLVYRFAVKNGFLDKITKHMPLLKKPVGHWTDGALKQEALKYKTKSDFMKKSSTAYTTAHKRNIINDICSHMTVLWEKKWTDPDIIKKEALKYKTKSDFMKFSSGAYSAALNMDLEFHKNVDTSGENSHSFKWSKEKVKEEATKYNNRSCFARKRPGAYSSAIKGSFLDEICSHMKISSNFSKPEQELIKVIKQKFPKAQKFIDTKARSIGKSHINSLHIDIYIPELRKGIEFDGTYWHSIEGLKRGRPNWPEEDLINYHQIKDSYFKSKGIEILHISETDWNKDKLACINKCLEFLR